MRSIKKVIHKLDISSTVYICLNQLLFLVSTDQYISLT